LSCQLARLPRLGNETIANDDHESKASWLAIDLGSDVNAANQAGNTALYSSAVSKSSQRLRSGTSHRRAVVRSYPNNKRETAEQWMEGMRKDENGNNK